MLAGVKPHAGRRTQYNQKANSECGKRLIEMYMNPGFSVMACRFLRGLRDALTSESGTCGQFSLPTGSAPEHPPMSVPHEYIEVFTMYLILIQGTLITRLLIHSSGLSPCPHPTPCNNSIISSRLLPGFPLRSRASLTGQSTKLAFKRFKMRSWRGFWGTSTTHVSASS